MRKRSFDLAATLLSSPLWLPVAGATALYVAKRLGTPVLFSQERPGLGGKKFRLYKFRTMTDDRDEAGNLLPDEQRMTPFGAFLRSTSLDELPTLYNVIRGDMSLVGPRPLLPEYLERYSAFQARRHEVRPGVTGWAQIHGRNLISWDEKFKLDVWYVDHQGSWLDLKIMFRTLATVLNRSGISAEGQATMKRFEG